MSIILHSELSNPETLANPAGAHGPGTKETPSAPESGKADSERNESEKSDPSETDEKESEADDQEDDAESDPESQAKDDEEEDLDAAEKEKPKKKGGFHRRIGKVIREKLAAQQEAEYWKREALKRATESQESPKADPPTTEANASEPNPDDYDNHRDYVRALTKWEVDQREKARDAKEQKKSLETEEQRLVRVYTERRDAFAAKTEDFDEVLAEVEDIPLSPAIREILLSSENGPELAYELAKNRDEYVRICQLPPMACAREVGKIEARLSASRASEEKKPQTKPITKAPKPLEPVKAGGKGSVQKSIYDRDISQAEYERIRAKQRAQRSG